MLSGNYIRSINNIPAGRTRNLTRPRTGPRKIPMNTKPARIPLTRPRTGIRKMSQITKSATRCCS